MKEQKAPEKIYKHFNNWWHGEGLTLRDEEELGYFSRSDMRWIAELAWKACEAKNYELQNNSTCGGRSE